MAALGSKNYNWYNTTRRMYLDWNFPNFGQWNSTPSICKLCIMMFIIIHRHHFIITNIMICHMPIGHSSHWFYQFISTAFVYITKIREKIWMRNCNTDKYWKLTFFNNILIVNINFCFARWWWYCCCYLGFWGFRCDSPPNTFLPSSSSSSSQPEKERGKNSSSIHQKKEKTPSSS
mgnify:CR=1 FL=1